MYRSEDDGSYLREHSENHIVEKVRFKADWTPAKERIYAVLESCLESLEYKIVITRKFNCNCTAVEPSGCTAVEPSVCTAV